MTPRPLGRIRDDETDRAEELYPFSAAAPRSPVERLLRVPRWRATHDQGREGSCVGHAVVMERAIVNSAELGRSVRYDPIGLWRAAKAVDEWAYTKPDDDHGTSVRAAYQVARLEGLRRVRTVRLVNGRPVPVLLGELELEHGVAEYRWARTVDEIRAAIAGGLAVTIGVDWSTGFDTPERRGRDSWLPLPGSLGRVRGGHAVALYGASDRLEAFRLVNSWGLSYPLSWIPYATMAHLLRRRGEAAIVTDLNN